MPAQSNWHRTDEVFPKFTGKYLVREYKQDPTVAYFNADMQRFFTFGRQPFEWCKIPD